MEKEKCYNNCVCFDSSSCPNKGNISAILRPFKQISPPPSRPYVVDKDIIRLANEICRSCESFEFREK